MADAHGFEAHAWRIHDAHGFIGHVGPIREEAADGGPLPAFQAASHHENPRGAVQGGMPTTMAERLLGAAGSCPDSGRHGRPRRRRSRGADETS
ncbi:hypothetical protein ACTZWW_01110 [Salinarimonas sp. NSM]|uniref:hypothetical protein n=1 Tax=Salinarimonas sp. NSM TaxID=3458003 RepID=UPI0040360966